MSKRIKSFLISLSSILVTALVAIMATPEWTSLVKDAYGWLSSVGVPASVIGVIGLLIAELWKAVLNKRIISKGSALVKTTRHETLRVDLY